MVALSSTLALTACGGSDDATPISMNSATPNATTEAPNSTLATTVTPVSDTTASNNTTIAGTTTPSTNASDSGSVPPAQSNADDTKPVSNQSVSTIIQKFGNAYAINSTEKKIESRGLTVQDINRLTINGKSYDLNVGSQTDFNEQKNEKAEIITSGTALSYSKFGFVADKEISDEDSKGYKEFLFYQGEITPVASMPATGTATYQGYGLIKKDAADMKANAAFDVDFEKKTIAGKLSNDNTSITLGGSIVGNQFGGNQDGYAMTGAFFGPQADELAGRYTNADSTVSGVFGAKK